MPLTACGAHWRHGYGKGPLKVACHVPSGAWSIGGLPDPGGRPESPGRMVVGSRTGTRAQRTDGAVRTTKPGGRGHITAGTHMTRNGHQHTSPGWAMPSEDERRIQDTVFLPRLTVADGEWLARILPALQRKARAASGAVRVEDVALRYRSGRLGIADALDAATELLAPFAKAGADLEHRGEWYICDDDENENDDDDDERPARLEDEPDQDLLLSARMAVDAAADDAGSAALHWAALALAE